MRRNSLRNFMASSLVAVLYVGSSSFQASAQPAGVKVVVERVERVSRDEVHFSVKIANGLNKTVFLPGANFGKPNPELLFLEQWREKEGWKTVVHCLDTPPPDLLKLKPNEAMPVEYVLELPLSVVCKERNVKLEGRFRYRLQYFESDREARAYIKKLFSPSWKEAHAPFVVSEPFEMPPPKR